MLTVIVGIMAAMIDEASTAPDPCSTDPDERSTADDQRSSGRRTMLRVALGAAAGAAVGLARSDTSLAADGGNVVLGNPNTATNATQVTASAGTAVIGETTAAGHSGVWGKATTGHGVHADATGVGGHAIHGEAPNSNGRGVVGVADGNLGIGVVGEAGAPGGIGVSGRSTHVAVYGEAVGASSIGGQFLGGAIGITGFGDTGVFGSTAISTGVHGESVAADGTGVKGVCEDGVGVAGSGNVGVYAVGTTAAVVVVGPAVWDDGVAMPPTSAAASPALQGGDDGSVWACVAAGTPGVWLKLAGPNTAGALHPITPTRVYDSRLPQPTPGVLASGQSRTVSIADARDTTSGAVVGAGLVPAGAIAIAFNLTIVDTVGSGWLLVNPGGVSTISASTINWSQSGSILANSTMVKVSATRTVTVIAGGGGSTNFLIDVIGYYR